MRRLTIPPEVAEILGPEQTAKVIKGPAPAEYRCVVCRKFGMVNDGEHIVGGLDIYTKSGGVVRLWLAHAECNPPVIRVREQAIELPKDRVAAAMCIMAGERPVLVFEETLVQVEITGDTSEIDQRQTSLLALGMAPVLGIDLPLAPHVPGWRVVMPKRAGATGGGAYGPTGFQLLSEMPPPPPGWAKAAIAAKWHCGLIAASRVGLTELSRLSEADLIAALNGAARNGQLIGVTARVGQAAR